MGYQGPLEGKNSFSARDSDRMLRHEIAKICVGQQPRYSKKASQYLQPIPAAQARHIPSFAAVESDHVGLQFM
jgi:hypothetical protein